MNVRPSILFVGTFFVALAFNALANAHPFHVSLAEVEWNKKSQSLEVALRVWPGDIESVLRQREGKRIDLDTTSKIDDLLTAYLTEKLRFFAGGQKSKDAKPLAIKWVGKEVNTKEAWLYFEVPFSDPNQTLSIENRLLFELLPDQQNTMIFKQKKKRSTLTFHQDKARQAIELAF